MSGSVGNGGWLTNGVQVVQPFVQNTVTIAPVPLTLVGSKTLFAADSEQASGAQPQNTAATAFQIASAAAALIANSATSTVHTATLNTTAGYMLTEALTTAAGADYTFQIVNSLFTKTSPAPQVQLHDGTNTAGAAVVKSVDVTTTTGTCTAVFTNTGTAAWNGTKILAFHT